MNKILKYFRCFFESFNRSWEEKLLLKALSEYPISIDGVEVLERKKSHIEDLIINDEIPRKDRISDSVKNIARERIKLIDSLIEISKLCSRRKYCQDSHENDKNNTF